MWDGHLISSQTDRNVRRGEQSHPEYTSIFNMSRVRIGWYSNLYPHPYSICDLVIVCDQTCRSVIFAIIKCEQLLQYADRCQFGASANRERKNEKARRAAELHFLTEKQINPSIANNNLQTTGFQRKYFNCFEFFSHFSKMKYPLLIFWESTRTIDMKRYCEW